MYRYSFCEIFAKKLLPSIKLYIAYKLVREHGFTQLEASKILGIKQPLINYMLSGKRKPKYLQLLSEIPGFREKLDDITTTIIRDQEISNLTCHICSVIKKEKQLLTTILEKLGYKYSEIYIP